MDVVIIGGVAGGMSAATRLRRLDESARITVIERSGYVSFANCGLPYHVGGVIDRRDALLLQTPESLAARFRLEVRVGHEAVRIERDRRVVVVRDLATGFEEEVRYDALILSPGATPVRPPIPGIERALSLRNVEDTDAMVEAVRDAKTAVVIGGGFIGLEMAENLVHRGVATAIVEATEQVMAPLDPEMVEPVHRRIRRAKASLHLGAAVTAIGDDDVTLSTGERLPADIVVAAIGVRPETGLATAAGLAAGPRGGIAIDEQFRTSDPHIYAVGDAVEKRDGLDGAETLIPLANTANRQGRFVADVIAGHPGADRGVNGTAIVGVFGLQVATTGWNEKRLRAANRPYLAVHTHPGSHAGYYPGADGMALKLLVDPDTDRILGAQGVGRSGVDKRIDVIATAMAGGLTASDLADLELAYAPQFSSAKDPVNMLGYVGDECPQRPHADDPVARARGGHDRGRDADRRSRPERAPARRHPGLDPHPRQRASRPPGRGPARTRRHPLRRRRPRTHRHADPAPARLGRRPEPRRRVHHVGRRHRAAHAPGGQR